MNRMNTTQVFDGLTAEGLSNTLEEYATANRVHNTNWTIGALVATDPLTYTLVLVRS